MSADLDRAREILKEGGCTCVLCRGELVYRSSARGVRPLLDWLDGGQDTCGFSAADLVVGKAAALLYSLLGVRRVYGSVMSLAAVKTLRKNGIEAYWDTLTEAITNRDGPCPLEAATAPIDDPDQALPVILAALRTMK